MIEGWRWALLSLLRAVTLSSTRLAEQRLVASAWGLRQQERHLGIPLGGVQVFAHELAAESMIFRLTFLA